MKVISVILIGLLLSGCAAQYRWTKSDKKYAAFAVIGQAADGLSTYVAMKNDFEESNNLLYGDHPSDSRIAIVKIVGTAAILLLAHAIPQHRKAILSVAGGLGFVFGIKNGLLINR